MRRTTFAYVATGALAIAMAAPPALANDADTREQQLEQRVRELESQLSDVMDRMDSTMPGELGKRVAELEAAMGADDTSMSTYWKNGVRMETANKRFTFRPFGRIHWDWLFYDDIDSELEAFTGERRETGSIFRRARVGFAGTLYDNVGFKAEYDFAGGDADFRDVYISLKNPCIGLIKAGHFKQPFGFEELTSSKYITFMERGAPAMMAPGYESGFMVSNNYGDDMWWGVSVFRDSNSYGDDKGDSFTFSRGFFDDRIGFVPPAFTSSGVPFGSGHGDSEYNFSGRIAGRPHVDADNHEYLHLGASLGLWNPNNDIAGVFSEGGNAVTCFPYVGGFFPADDGTAIGLDAAFVSGPFQIVGEYARTDWDVVGGSDADFDAWNIYASYFLTGESRPYSTKNANFSRQNVTSNYADPDATGDGLGAWEVALRYDDLDLDDGGIDLGELEQWTLGLNWYLNPHTRVMLNYVMGDVDGVGDVDILGVRFAIDF